MPTVRRIDPPSFTSGRAFWRVKYWPLKFDVDLLVERLLRYAGNRRRAEDPGVEEQQVKRPETFGHRRHENVGVGQNACVGSDDEYVVGQLEPCLREGIGVLFR
jgi:hypothetical protein